MTVDLLSSISTDLTGLSLEDMGKFVGKWVEASAARLLREDGRSLAAASAKSLSVEEQDGQCMTKADETATDSTCTGREKASCDGQATCKFVADSGAVSNFGIFTVLLVFAMRF